MSTATRKSTKARRRPGIVKGPRSSSAPAVPPTASPGDLARATFAHWDKAHLDPKPITWKKLQAVLEKNRLREAPLFSE
jgi:hypothetical protein